MVKGYQNLHFSLRFSVNNIHPAVANANVPMDGNRPVAVSQAPRVNNSYPTGMENGPTSPGQPYHPSQNHPSQNHPSQNHPSQNHPLQNAIR